MSKKVKNDNWGGARENSGPKTQSVSVKQLQDMRDAAEKKAKQEGRSLFDVCLDWIFDKEIPIARQQAAWKMYTDKMLIQVSEGGEADKIVGPAIFLPEEHPRLEVIDGGKGDEDEPA